MTNAVVYYSNTHQSEHIARYFADKLNYPLYDVHKLSGFDFYNLVFVFPVHCQSLPDEAKRFLSKIKVSNLTLIATYGRMCRGNALYEVQRRYSHNIVASAYVPTKHSYLNDSEFNRFDALDSIIQKILSPSPVKIPRSYKNPFAEFFKAQRSRLGVKIRKNEKCNCCGECSSICNKTAIKNGIPNANCVRCLKCVYECPHGALEYTLSFPMRKYLSKKKQDDLIIYI